MRKGLEHELSEVSYNVPTSPRFMPHFYIHRIRCFLNLTPYRFPKYKSVHINVYTFETGQLVLQQLFQYRGNVSSVHSRFYGCLCLVYAPFLDFFAPCFRHSLVNELTLKGQVVQYAAISQSSRFSLRQICCLNNESGIRRVFSICYNLLGQIVCEL